MAIPKLKESDLNIVPVKWRKLIQNKINLLIGSNTGAPKLIYKALLSQTGSNAPSVVVLENTLGEIVWTRATNGAYVGTLSNMFPSESKVFILCGQISDLVSAAVGYYDSLNTVNLDSYIVATATKADDILTYTPILIEVSS